MTTSKKAVERAVCECMTLEFRTYFLSTKLAFQINTYKQGRWKNGDYEFLRGCDCNFARTCSFVEQIRN
eukprot:154246-Amphidinium_carterae.1